MPTDNSVALSNYVQFIFVRRDDRNDSIITVPGRSKQMVRDTEPTNTLGGGDKTKNWNQTKPNRTERKHVVVVVVNEAVWGDGGGKGKDNELVAVKCYHA